MLQWKQAEEFVPINSSVNVFVVAFTTVHARLHLYNIMEALGQRVLYYVTDSVIYRSKPGQYHPPCGDQLGELIDEQTCAGVGCKGCTEGHYIQEFVSGGKNNYVYHLNTGQTICKVRRFTHNHANSKLINFDSIKELVTKG